MRVRRSAIETMVDHARREAPLECCGLLLGCGDAVDQAWPARNTRASEVRFEVDPADHFAAIREARRSARLVIGAYHSHPCSAAVPSPRDIAESRDAAFFHVIVSLVDDPPELRAFRIAGGNFVELPFVREP